MVKTKKLKKTKRNPQYKRKRHSIVSIKKRKGGKPRTEKYSDEDMAYLIQYIKTLPEGEKKSWIETNIHRLPYERDYVFIICDEDDIRAEDKKYMQGKDRIAAYLKYGDDW